MVGVFYRLGLGGVAQDAREAFGWYGRTATQPDRCVAKSQYALYASYLSGQGVRKDVRHDPALARMWLLKSREGVAPHDDHVHEDASQPGQAHRGHAH
jgi:TPR repeat protein